jgi:hypothetical protein
MGRWMDGEMDGWGGGWMERRMDGEEDGWERVSASKIMTKGLHDWEKEKETWDTIIMYSENVHNTLL